MLSCFSPVWLFVALWTVACPASRSCLETPRQEYWSGLPCPPPGDLPNPGLPHCKRILYCLSHQGSPRILEWVAYPFSRGSSQPRNQTGVSCIAVCHTEDLLLIFCHCQRQRWGTALAIQGLGLCTPNSGDPGRLPGQGTRSHMLQLRPSAAK